MVLPEKVKAGENRNLNLSEITRQDVIDDKRHDHVIQSTPRRPV